MRSIRVTPLVRARPPHLPRQSHQARQTHRSRDWGNLADRAVPQQKLTAQPGQQCDRAPARKPTSALALTLGLAGIILFASVAGAWPRALGALYVLLMMCSRTYLSARWLTDTDTDTDTDTVAGALLGASLALLPWPMFAARITPAPKAA